MLMIKLMLMKLTFVIFTHTLSLTLFLVILYYDVRSNKIHANNLRNFRINHFFRYIIQ